MQREIRWILSFCLIASCAPRGPSQGQDQTKQLAHDIFKQLIEINTTDSVGDVTTAAEAMAKRLRDGGFAESDIKVAGPLRRRHCPVRRVPLLAANGFADVERPSRGEGRLAMTNYQ